MRGRKAPFLLGPHKFLVGFDFPASGVSGRRATKARQWQGGMSHQPDFPASDKLTG